MQKLRLIQCGVGGFGEGWVKNFAARSPDFELVAIVDVSEAALKTAGDAVGVAPERRFGALEAALEKVSADAIVTVTPPAVHVHHARLAFSRGLHVMTEKPIADTMENARAMVRMARDAGRQLLVSQNYRFTPLVQKVKQVLVDKVLGEFGHGHLDFYIPADFTGTFRQSMPYPLLVDMAIHHVDLIRCVTGRNIAKVTAQTFNSGWSWYAHDAGLKMLLELDGGDDGGGNDRRGDGARPLPFSYSGDWTARGRSTAWHGSWRLQCAEGSLHLEHDKITIERNERWGKNPTTEAVEPAALERQNQDHTLHDFAEAIRTGRPGETSGEDNLWSFGAVMAGVHSAQEGRAVQVGELVRG